MNVILKKYIFLVPAILLLAYTSVRAYQLSFTVDEATSFMRFSLDSYRHIFFPVLLDANNHVLNTALMKFFSSALPLSEFTLRLQSLIAHIIFLVFTWLLLKDFDNVWLRLCAWLFINLNPYMLDFFSLARGYALSWAMMVGSLYFLRLHLTSSSKKSLHIILSLAFGGISVLSNFTMLDYFLPLIVCYTIIWVFRFAISFNEKMPKGKLFIELLIATIVCFPIIFYSAWSTIALAKAHLFYFGGDQGFWVDTVSSLISGSLYGLSYPEFVNTLVKIFMITVTAISILFVIVKLLKNLNHSKTVVNQQKRIAFFIVLLSIFILVILSINIQFYTLATKFVVQRAAIFILILFSILLAQLLNSFEDKISARILIIFLALLSIVHFARVFNLSYVHEWKMNADTKNMVQTIEKLQTEKDYQNRNDILLEPQSEFVSTSQFYQYLYHLKHFTPFEKDYYINQHADRFYYFDTSMARFKNQPVEIIKRFPLSQTVLLKNLNKKPISILTSQTINMWDTLNKNPDLKSDFTKSTINGVHCVKVPKNHFGPGIKFDVKKLAGKTGVHINVKATVYFLNGYKSGNIDISQYDKQGKLLWLYFPFNQYLLQDSGWMTIPYNERIDYIEPDANPIEIRIDNSGDSDIYVSELKVEITD